MELNSTMKDTWKYLTIASLLICLIILVFFNDNRQNVVNVPNSSVTFFVPNNESSFVAIAPSMIVVAPQSQPQPQPSSPPPKSSTISEPSDIGSHHDYIKVDSVVGKPNDNNTKALIPKDSVNNVTLNSEAKAVYQKSGVVESFEKVSSKNDVVGKQCNLFDGKWVYKADAKPSYCLLKCPFVEDKMNCQRNGRPDFEYEKWVWEANDCDIPMLNGTDLVERFRNKRVVFVGDSLNRNMWESLACLLYSSIPIPSSRAKVINEFLHVKTFLEAKEDYNFTVEFYWSPFLVQLDKNHTSGKRVLVLDKLSPNSKVWSGADIMIFNSAHHWPQVGKKKAWDLFEYKGKLTNDMPLHQAYARAMKTWANWVEQTVDPKKTAVFFRSVSAEHISLFYNQWCYTRTQPMFDVESYKPPYPKIMTRIIEKVIKGMKKFRVTYLNITRMSEYRIDAHPSIYRVKEWKLYSQINKNNLTAWADCGHWCLPGVPDTWNRLLYASLYFNNTIRDIHSS